MYIDIYLDCVCIKWAFETGFLRWNTLYFLIISYVHLPRREQLLFYTLRIAPRAATWHQACMATRNGASDGDHGGVLTTTRSRSAHARRNSRRQTSAATPRKLLLRPPPSRKQMTVVRQYMEAASVIRLRLFRIYRSPQVLQTFEEHPSYRPGNIPDYGANNFTLFSLCL